MAATWLVVGLGNPGEDYARTRHNFGFMALEEGARRWKSEALRTPFTARVEQAARSENRLVLMWPETYMNLSGEAVVAAVETFEIDPEHIIVIHDDVDLPVGRLKVKKGGGDGGHRGLISIIWELQSADFTRIRGGVGRPERAEPAPLSGDMDDDPDLTDHVLSPFAPDETEHVDEMIQRACDAAEVIMDDGVVAAMNRFNARRTTPHDEPDSPNGETSPNEPTVPDERS